MTAELDKFRVFSRKWIITDAPDAEPEVEDFRACVDVLYSELGYAPPQIVLCSGPLEQITFPALVGLFLELGQSDARRPGFEQSFALGTREVLDSWNGLWSTAYGFIDWSKLASFNLTKEPLLNSQIEHHMTRQFRNTVLAYIDQEIGMEVHQELEKALRSLVRTPFLRRLRSLSTDRTERTNIWNSFVARLPVHIRTRLKQARGRKESGNVFLSRPKFSDWLGRGEWDWLSIADYTLLNSDFRPPAEAERLLNCFIQLSLRALSYLFYEHVCFVYLMPREAFFDDRLRPHHATRAALNYLDGTSIFFWHGIEVPERVIVDPRSIKLNDILSERNAEVRRVLIERYGIDNFTLVARKVQEDEYGSLHVKELPGDEAFTVVKVLNSTPEPDGTFKYYFLRVPPGTKTAREGIAWTFGLTEEEYVLTEES